MAAGRRGRNKKPGPKPKPNPVGRPPMYNTPEELQAKIEEYFEGGFRKVRRIVGGKEVEMPKITISDLVLFLGFCDRHSFYEYEKKPEFTHTIKRARSMIEREYEDRLTENNPAGAIFALKNFNWTDKQEITHGFDAATLDLILSALPPEYAVGVRRALESDKK